MKIAYYFGSFNPIHNGHLRVIEKALDDNNIDRVIIVPAMHNPHKKDAPIDIEERASLIKLALLMHKNKNLFYKCVVDTIEEKLTAPYYTYNTLKALDERYKADSVSIICGQDMIEKVPKWYKGNEILEKYNFIVSPRTTESSTEVRECVKINDLQRLGELIPSCIIKRILTIYN